MLFPKHVRLLSCFLSPVVLAGWALGQPSVIVQTNTVVRVMASNLTSGNYSRYEAPGLRILKGLKPDIVAIQEFNYLSPNGLGQNTAAAIREMIDTTFGTNFSYFRESIYDNASGGGLPNGIISRYPILNSGTWEDTTSIDNRGFAWARIRLPETNDLYVISVHLKASSGYETQRATEATNLTAFIQANFPAGAWIIVAGDFNTYSPTEPCLAKFQTYLSDSPIPNDGGSPSPDADTNEPRSRRYDYILPSFSLTNCLTPTVLGSSPHTDGLVFDSSIYTALTNVAPVLFEDSHVSGMQHMGVVKDFKISYSIALEIPQPCLTMLAPGVVAWSGLSNLAYSVQMKWSLDQTSWENIGTVTSTGSQFCFTNTYSGTQQFFRVVYP